MKELNLSEGGGACPTNTTDKQGEILKVIDIDQVRAVTTTTSMLPDIEEEMIDTDHRVIETDTRMRTA